MNARIVSVVTLALAAAACGGEAPPPPKVAAKPVVAPPPKVEAPPPVRETPDAPFRAKPPAADGTIAFVAPKPVEMTLSNGVRVLLVEQHALPVVAVRLVIAGGAGDVPNARPGAVSFLGAMVEQGTQKRTALQISDDYEALGVQHGSWFDWDSGGVSSKSLADKLDPALEIMSDVALSPTFPQAEIDRLRARRIASIRSEKSSPGTVAQNALAAAVFGRAHPYGHSLSGEETDTEKLTRDELVKIYDRVWSPKNAALVVAGDVTKDVLLPKLEATFGKWKAKPGAAARKSPAAPTQKGSSRLVVVDRAGAQSQIQLARVGVPYAGKDREAIIVTNAILGGMFSSRVNMNLREKHGYTYGARSHFTMRHGAGPFSVGAAVHADKTVPAIKEVLSELEALRRDGPTEDELALAKESWLLAMPGRFETTSDVANAFAELLVHDLPLDDYDKRRARVEAVTAADVKRIATQLLGPDAMTVIVVGDKAKLAPELETLKLGPIEERDFYGNPVTAAAKAGPPAAGKKP